ncbi:MAG: hypothetical protein R3F43_32045 [bacterium]
MTRNVFTHLMWFALLLATAGAAPPHHRRRARHDLQPHDPGQAATRLLKTYEAALNAGDVDAILALYADDATFMAQHRTHGHRPRRHRDRREITKAPSASTSSSPSTRS